MPSFLGFVTSLSVLAACVGTSYIFMRGLLGVFYEIAGWVVRVLD